MFLLILIFSLVKTRPSHSTTPQFATILINTSRNHSRLIINNEKEILSQEGTTQSDNLALYFYTLISH